MVSRTMEALSSWEVIAPGRGSIYNVDHDNYDDRDVDDDNYDDRDDDDDADDYGDTVPLQVHRTHSFLSLDEIWQRLDFFLF